MSEGKFKNLILYTHRTFMDLYYDREERFSESQKNIEAHPDPLLDNFISMELMEGYLNQAKKEFPHIHKLPDGSFIYDAKEGEQWFKKWFGHE
jgi:hypothetical protein